MEKNNVRPFGMIDKLAYLTGDLANDFTFMLVMFAYMMFCTSVLGLSPTLVGTLFLTARIVDAFTDVTMGRIVDNRVAGEDGKFRFWIKRVAPFVCIAGFMLFAHWVKDLPYSYRVAYAFTTYLFWGSICYTAVNIPYGSMASAITDNPDERAQLSAFRSMGASIANITISLAYPFIVFTKNAQTGEVLPVPERFTLFAGICCVLGYIFYMICYKFTIERVKPKEVKKEKTSISRELKAVWDSVITNKTLLSFVLVALTLLVTMMLAQALNVYLYKDYFKSREAMALGGTLATVGTFVLMPFVKPIIAKLGKQKSSAIAVSYTAIMYVIAYLLQISNVKFFLIFIFLTNLGYTFFNIVIWSFIIDIIDDTEVRTKSRDDGTIYAAYSFARKIGQALAGGLSGYALAFIGYNTAKNAVQTPEVAQSLFNLYTLFSAVGFGICAILLYFVYPLTKEKVDTNAQILRDRKGK